ncbi:MAG: endonuclease/exonuclease/phosphatase family protein [Micropruina sp.]|uniref:endonuclease/exonuclease/phosphatase family protein n=1 Tax=Micropruina sp. TaxID=2737536 RepID=UPI0039E53A72
MALRRFISIPLIASLAFGALAAPAAISPTPAMAKAKAKPKPKPKPSSPALRVASYNILCSTCGGPSWSSRRTAVASTIKNQKPDVVGIQEASQGKLPGKQVSQYSELLSTLGSPYRAANSNGYNCERVTTPSKCVYKDQGASQGTRIIYNSSTVTLLAQGSRKLTSASGAGDRYVAWARFQQRSSGKKFLFVNAHLEHRKSDYYYELRKTQTRQVLDTLKQHRDSLPVVMVGDWNSDKWAKPSNAPSDLILGAGFVDPLGHVYRSKAIGKNATVEKRIRTNYWSVNHLKREAQHYPEGTNGVNIDQIYVSPMRVSEFEVVVKLDKKGRFVGTIPSDHNMLRATVHLP